jgi:hypothetical protein
MEILFRRKLGQIVTKANLALGRSSVMSDSAILATTTKSIIDTGVWQLDQMKKECPGDRSK